MVHLPDLRQNPFLMPVSELQGDKLLQEHYIGEVEGILIPYHTIRQRVEEIARQLTGDYRMNEVLFVYLRNGSKRFSDEIADSVDKLNLGLRYAPLPLTAKSYHGNTSSGNVVVDESELAKIRNLILEDRRISEVVLIEDIVDTGMTMKRVLRDVARLREHPNLCVSICTLLDKPDRRRDDCMTINDSIQYVGFTIPDVFVIGFGLDYNDRFRDMDHIGIPTREAIEKYA